MERTATAKVDEILATCTLAGALGIDSYAPAVVNAIRELVGVVDYAVSQRWAKASDWLQWQAQLQKLTEILDLHGDVLRETADSGTENAVRGALGAKPHLGLLVARVSQNLAALGGPLKAALAYQLVYRPTAANWRAVADSLRLAFEGRRNHKQLLSLAESLQETSFPYTSWEVARYAKGSQKNASQDERRFLEKLLNLLNIENDEGSRPTIARLPEITAHSEDNDLGQADIPVGALLSQRNELAAEELIYVVQTDIGELIAEGTDLGVVEGVAKAKTLKASHWIEVAESAGPFAWTALNPIERQWLVRRLFVDSRADDDRRHFAMLALLSICTGQTIEHLLNMRLGPGEDIGPPIYRRQIRRPENAYRPDTQALEFLEKTSESIELTLPDSASGLISAYLKPARNAATIAEIFGSISSNISEAYSRYLTQLRNESEYRINASRVAAMLRQTLLQKGVSRMAVHILSSRPNDAAPIDAYYYAYPTKVLRQYYADAMDDILK